MHQNKLLKITYRLLKKLGNKGFLNYLDDTKYLKLLYYTYFNRKLNLENPETFNEKLQWLKLFNRDPHYIDLVDKYNVRDFVRDTIGEEYLIPLIGAWDNVDDIEWNSLPNQFVLKATHDSGGIVICKDKSTFDYEKAIRKLNKSMKTNYYYGSREWPYKNVKPRIIAEKYMVDDSSPDLKDYKFMCFNGEPKVIQVMSNRDEGDFDINHYDLNWRRLDIRRLKNKENEEGILKPDNLVEMIKLSRKLSEDRPFSRIDLYNINGDIYFGEITLFPASGFMDFEDLSVDVKLGDWIKLPTA